MRVHLLAMEIAAVLIWMLAGVAPSLLPVPTAVRLAMVAALAAAFLAFALQPFSRSRTRRMRFRMQPTAPGAWPRTLLAAVLLPAALLGLYALTHGPTDRPAAATLPLAWATIASAILLAPLVEEAIFRGSMQQRMERQLGAHAGILVTSGLFAGLHLDVATFLPHLLSGLVFGYAAWTAGSIWPAVALHVVTNLALALLAPTFATYSRVAPVASALALAAGLVGLAVLYGHASRNVPARPTRTRLFHAPADA